MFSKLATCVYIRLNAEATPVVKPQLGYNFK